MKIRHMRAELFYADGLIYTYDIATSFFRIFAQAPKN